MVTSDYKKSIELAMDFIKNAWITNVQDPKYYGYNHAYLLDEGRWNGAYTELGMQVIFDALIPYYEYSKDPTWLNLAEKIILDWAIPMLQNNDPHSITYGALLEPYMYYQGSSEWCDYDTFNAANGILAFLMVHRHTENKAILDSAHLMSGFLRRMTNRDHSLKMGYTVRTDKLDSRTPIFSPGYAAWAYSYWHHLSGEETYKKWAVEYCDWIAAQQRSNGWLSPSEVEVAEFIIYAVEGLYWTGRYCEEDGLIDKAKITLDALIKAEKNGPGNLYLTYNSDWTPKPSSQVDLLSTCGQYAKLCHHLYERTRVPKYRHEYFETLKFLYDIQDRGPSSFITPGSFPRATNLPNFREVCPGYTYVGAVLLEPNLLSKRSPSWAALEGA